MSRIEIVTLNAEYVEGWDAENREPTGEVILRFGGAEIAHWNAVSTYFRFEEDRAVFVEEFIAGKLAALLAGVTE